MNLLRAPFDGDIPKDAAARHATLTGCQCPAWQAPEGVRAPAVNLLRQAEPRGGGLHAPRPLAATAQGLAMRSCTT